MFSFLSGFCTLNRACLESCRVHTCFVYSQFVNNTFQAVLITNDVNSYAVFIYKCGGMNWGGGEIGWRASSSEYEFHSLSGRSDSNDIGCLYSDTFSAVVYRLHRKCACNTVVS